ncbi:iron ABC transporter permease [Thiomicrorhabdus sp. 6S3-12]|uniref:FecCD family ABC transporter permease n=1 Tax=Thiomicrorhabdus sp. 6S3-12 TaxID=2819681 RepID=UPI001AACCE69|nr:iron ABC transporter permease [Thiomicrorhabdus sp. 6S3-12]MBO1923021.1 iron ABC transporter permease [Thiomicrorhabdus sp. 6S3-12]
MRPDLYHPKACCGIFSGAQILLLLSLILLATAGLSLSLGRYDFAPLGSLAELLKYWGLIDGAADPMITSILLDVRLPRIAAAIMIGSALAISGAAFQALFMNPLVSPGILGVLSGAAFGASLGILLSEQIWVMQLLTFVFGLLAVFIALMLAKGELKQNMIILVLGGMITGALFSAFLSIIKYVADPYSKLPAITYWLMGSLANVNGELLLWLLPFVVLGLLILSLHGHVLNVLSLGDDEARSLGVNVERKRLLVIVIATFLSALTVTLGGMIGWVGLVIPHIVRLLLGADNRLLLPASALLGAIYLLVVDNLARMALSIEIPIGILTALIGLPVFAWALKNAKKGWQN